MGRMLNLYRISDCVESVVAGQFELVPLICFDVLWIIVFSLPFIASPLAANYNLTSWIVYVCCVDLFTVCCTFHALLAYCCLYLGFVDQFILAIIFLVVWSSILTPVWVLLCTNQCWLAVIATACVPNSRWLVESVYHMTVALLSHIS